MDASRPSGLSLVRHPTAATRRRTNTGNAVSTFVRERPRAAATLSLWVVGLFIAFLAPAPIASEF